MAGVADSRQKLEAAKDELDKAEAHRAQALRSVERARRGLEDVQSDLRRAETDLSDRQREQGRIKSDINEAERRVRNARQNLRR